MTLTDQALTGVFGAHGVQGAAIEGGLARLGARTRGLGRSRRHGQRKGAVPGHESHVDREYADADLAQPSRLAEAFKGLSSLCFTMPLVYDSNTTRTYAHNVATAAVDAGIERLVLNSNTRIPAQPTGVAGFETRRATEDILGACGIPIAVIRPTIYLENLLAPPVVEAVVSKGALPYPLPADTPIAWLSVQDLGTAIAQVLAADEFPEGVIEVGGRDLTGDELAAQFGSSLGTKLSFVSLDPSDFENGLAYALGDDAARGVAGLYHWLSANPESELMTGGATELSRHGTEPTSIANWVATSWP